ncbi:hypothetical protein WDU94_011362, partial [Cyamophila willieti]
GSQTGVRGPPGGRERFPGTAGPRKKKLRHNLLKSPYWCFKLKHDFQTTFETFYTLTFQVKGLRRFRRVSRHDFKKLSTF